MSAGYVPFSADGHQARWVTWDADGEETTTLQWENEGWTVSGVVSRERLQYVVRITPAWKVSQFILFRDVEEPDLWLATDGSARWGEMNGAHRPELDGCYDIQLACTPFTTILPIRRLPLLTGHAAEIPVVVIDPETLDVHAETHRYSRLDTHRWGLEQLATGHAVEFDVDEHGLVIDYPDRFRRVH
jgi:hypothetical protein